MALLNEAFTGPRQRGVNSRHRLVLKAQLDAMPIQELLKLNQSAMFDAIDCGVVGRALKAQLGAGFPAARASEIIAPLLPDLRYLMAGVIEGLPADFSVRTVAASSTLLGRRSPIPRYRPRHDHPDWLGAGSGRSVRFVGSARRFAVMIARILLCVPSALR